MTGREYLEQWRDHATAANRNETEIEYYNGMQKQAAREELENDDIKETCKEEIKHNKRELQAHKKEMEKIQNTIARLPDPLEREIIQMRYLQRKPATWETIAEKLNYSVRNCYAMHRRALEHIEKLRPK